MVDHFSQQMGLAGSHIVYICGHLKESAEVLRVFVFNQFTTPGSLAILKFLVLW
jgi:hypothetical protein